MAVRGGPCVCIWNRASGLRFIWQSRLRWPTPPHRWHVMLLVTLRRSCPRARATEQGLVSKLSKLRVWFERKRGAVRGIHAAGGPAGHSCGTPCSRRRAECWVGWGWARQTDGNGELPPGSLRATQRDAPVQCSELAQLLALAVVELFRHALGDLDHAQHSCIASHRIARQGKDACGQWKRPQTRVCLRARRTCHALLQAVLGVGADQAVQVLVVLWVVPIALAVLDRPVRTAHDPAVGTGPVSGRRPSLRSLRPRRRQQLRTLCHE